MSTTPFQDPSSDSLSKRVGQVLERIRPALQRDGGDVEFIGVDAHGVVKVRFQGACVGCPSRNMTLAFGIEQHLRAEVPEVTKVICA